MQIFFASFENCAQKTAKFSFKKQPNYTIHVSHVCEIFDIKSPMARNLTNLVKSNR